MVLLRLERAALEGSPDAGATLVGAGWVVADAEITELTVLLAGRVLGSATYGLARADVAADFPHYPDASHAGFSFALPLPPGIGPDAALALRAGSRNGGEALRRIVLRPEPSRRARPADAPWPVRLDVDGARLDAAGVLHVRGWVATLAGLRSVRLFLGEVALGLPETGLRRTDVAASHGAYPDAARSGFRLSWLCGTPPEAAPLRVVAEGEDGVRRTLLVPVERPPAARLLPGTQPGADTGSRLACDAALLRPDGGVVVSGWAVAEAGVLGITVLLDGVALGAAETGLSRPDVGTRFPRLPGAHEAGFRFLGHAGAAGRRGGLRHLTLRVRDGAGAARDVVLALPVRDGLPTPPEPAMRLVLDGTFGADAPTPVPGSLRLSGWTLAGTGGPVAEAGGVEAGGVEAGGVEAVEVLLGERLLGRAVLGLRREDVATAHPERDDALLAGFVFSAPPGTLGPGEHRLRVAARGGPGVLAEQDVLVTVPEATGPLAVETIRTRVGAAEAELGLAVLGRLGASSHLVLVLVEETSPAGQARLAATLAGLAGQAHRGWQARLVLPEGAAPSWLAALLADPALEDRVTLHAAPAAATAADPGAKPAGPGPTHYGVLRAGDVLGADALLELSLEAGLSVADFVFADERRIDPATGLAAAFLKPGWSPDLLLAQNYVGRPWCASAACWAAAGIDPAALPALGEHDAVLRLTEAARTVRHLPGVLCLRPGTQPDTPPGGVAALPDAAEPDPGGVATPGDTPDQEQAAIAAALARRGERATPGPGRAPGTWRVRREARPGRISVVIPTIAARGLIETTLRGLREATHWADLEVVCVNNLPAGEQPQRRAWLRAHADRVVEAPGPFNWSRLNNLGAAAATGELLLFLNDDVEVIEPGWLAALAEQAWRPEVGVAGAQLLYPDGTVQHAGLAFSPEGGRHVFRFLPGTAPGPFGLAVCEREVLAVTGACMLMRRATFDALGGFDEAHAVVNNDVDFCLRARRSGLRVLYAPQARLVHHELASRAGLRDVFDAAAFRSAWGGLLLGGDPFRNRLLAAGTDDWVAEAEPVRVVHAGSPMLARGQVRRILAMKLDHLGDFVLALPALRRLKQRFPAARLCVLAAGASLPLARLEPAIDEAIAFDFFHVRSVEGERGVSAVELAALAERLAPYRFDLAIDLRMHPDTRHVLRHTGAACLAGFEHAARFPWLDVPLHWEGDAALLAKRAHVGDRLLQLVEAVSLACEPRPEPLPLPRQGAAGLPDAVPAGFRDGPLVCVHPGVGNAIRQWPARHFAGLIDLLVEREGVQVLLIGAAGEAAVAEAVLARVARPEAVLSLVGRTGLAELPAVLRAASLYVGNNSGPQHLAAALGVPTVGVHSAVVDAVEWGPVGHRAAAIRREVTCGPCYLASAAECPRGLACLEELQPADVFQLCRRLLALGRE